MYIGVVYATDGVLNATVRVLYDVGVHFSHRKQVIFVETSAYASRNRRTPSSLAVAVAAAVAPRLDQRGSRPKLPR